MRSEISGNDMQHSLTVPTSLGYKAFTFMRGACSAGFDPFYVAAVDASTSFSSDQFQFTATNETSWTCSNSSIFPQVNCSSLFKLAGASKTRFISMSFVALSDSSVCATIR